MVRYSPFFRAFQLIILILSSLQHLQKDLSSLKNCQPFFGLAARFDVHVASLVFIVRQAIYSF